MLTFVLLWTGKHSFTHSVVLKNIILPDILTLKSKHSATGEPRGFAHADFLDIESAVKAKAKLEEAEVYGRRLRVDFSGNRREGGSGGPGGFSRGDRGDRRGGGGGGYQNRDGRGGYGDRRGGTGPSNRSLNRGQPEGSE